MPIFTVCVYFHDTGATFCCEMKKSVSLLSHNCLGVGETGIQLIGALTDRTIHNSLKNYNILGGGGAGYLSMNARWFYG